MVRKPFLILQTSLISGLIGLIGLYFILRYYGRGTYGTLVFTLSLLGTFNILADVGFTAAHVRHVSRGEDEAACNGTFLLVKLALAGLTVALVVAFLGVYVGVLGNHLYDTSTRLILVATLYYVFIDFTSVGLATFNARRETAKSQLVTLVDPAVRVPLVIVLGLVHPDLQGLTVSYVTGAAAASLVALALLLRMPIGRPSWRLFRSYLRFSTPLFFVAPANALANNVDKLIIGFFYVGREVGSYSGVEGLFVGLAVLYSAINTLSFPLFSKLEAEGRSDEIKQVLRKAERYLLAILIPIITVLVVLARPVLLALLDLPRLQDVTLMRVYALAFGVYALGMVYYPILLAAGRTDISRTLALVYVIAFAGLCFLLVPRGFLGVPLPGLGAVGAAYALLATNLLNTIAMRYTAWRVAAIPSSPRLGLHLGAGAVTGGALYVLVTLYPFSTLLPLVAASGVALAVQGGILYGLGELTKRDLREVWVGLHPGEMSRYIAAELRNLR